MIVRLALVAALPVTLACDATVIWEPKPRPLTNRIVFSAAQLESSVFRPYAMEPDGSGVFELLVPQAASVYSAGVSPDGLKFAFVSLDDLWVVGVDGKGQQNLTASVGEVRDAAWSHDGTRIAFTALRGPDFEVYVMNADGSGMRTLSNHAAHDSDPSWSPDDSHIIFVTARNPNAQLYIMNSDGSDQRPFTIAGPSAAFPSWSPDGQKIAFVAGDIGSMALSIANVDGSRLRQLPTPGYTIWSADWSPDGRRLVLSCLGPKLSLCVIDENGTGFLELTANSGAGETNPSWLR